MGPREETALFTFADAVTSARIAGSPALILLGVAGWRWPFLLTLVGLLVSDLVDGFIARRQSKRSRYGAELDTVGDMAMYASLGIGAWQLWPDIVLPEMWLIALGASLIFASSLFGLIKLRHLPSYHTRSAKAAAGTVGVSSLMLLTGISPWPFRLSMGLLFLSTIEEMLITLLLKEWRRDIRTFMDLL